MRRTTPIASWDKDHSTPLRCGSSVLLSFWGHFFNRFYYILHVSCVSVCVCYTQTTTTHNTGTDTRGEFFMGCKGCMIYNNYLFIFSFILSSQTRSLLMLYHNSKAVFYRTTNTEISMLLFPSHPVSILCHSYSLFFIISILSLFLYFSLSLSRPRLFYNVFCFITARLSSAVFYSASFCVSWFHGSVQNINYWRKQKKKILLGEIGFSFFCLFIWVEMIINITPLVGSTTAETLLTWERQ